MVKFDIMVGNPPYGLRTGNIHFKILKAVLPYCTGRLVFIMPSKPLVEESEYTQMLREAVCTDVHIMSKDIFPTTDMEATAIYTIDINAVEYCSRLDVNKIVYDMIDNPAHRLYIDKMKGGLKMYSHVHGNTIPEIRAAKRRIKEEGYYLNINRANGSYDGRWLSGYLKTVDILDRQSEIGFITGKMYNIIYCPNKTYGENLKKLLQGVVLRYGLWLTQSNRFILDNQFKYLPNIDYTGITTDSQLLETCGFNEKEVKLLVEYLENFDFNIKRNDLIREFKKRKGGQ